MRERRTYGSVRGLRREPLVYSTVELDEKRDLVTEVVRERGAFDFVFPS